MDDTGNTAQERGGGAYVYGEGTFSVSDVPDITGNKAGGKDSNVYPPSGKTIGITVTVANPQSGATIGYSQDGANYSEKKIEYTVAQSATPVYYRISAPGYVSAYGSATVKIDQIDAAVTVTGRQSSVPYDGKAHTVEGYDFKASTPLYTENDFTFSGSAVASQTDAGTAKVIITDKPGGNYVVNGEATFTIEKRPATVTASDRTVKAGGEIKTGVKQVKATGLLKGHTLKSVKLTSSSTAKATARGTITPGGAVIVAANGLRSAVKVTVK